MIAAGTLFLASVIGWHGQATAGSSVLLDNFKCYLVTAETLPNPKPVLSLFDQFESDVNTVIEPNMICTPTSVDGSRRFQPCLASGLLHHQRAARPGHSAGYRPVQHVRHTSGTRSQTGNPSLRAVIQDLYR